VTCMRLLPLFGLAMLALPACGADTAARAAAVAAIFERHCLDAPPTFTSIDARATSEKFDVFEDRRIPISADKAMHQKEWLIASGDGAHVMLTANDTVNGDIHVTGCGVYAPDVDADSLETALSGLPRMGAAREHVSRPDGTVVTWWWAALGMHAPSDDSKVMMSRNVPRNPGVNVNLIYRMHSAL